MVASLLRLHFHDCFVNVSNSSYIIVIASFVNFILFSRSSYFDFYNIILLDFILF
jgi:hypothetical protein